MGYALVRLDTRYGQGGQRASSESQPINYPVEKRRIFDQLYIECVENETNTVLS